MGVTEMKLLGSQTHDAQVTKETACRMCATKKGQKPFRAHSRLLLWSAASLKKETHKFGTKKKHNPDVQTTKMCQKMEN